MRSRAALLPLLILGAGLALLADAAIRGTAHLSIFLIVPVLSGSSPEFVIGTLLAFLGLFGVLFAGAGFELE
ncbi:MAG: hypothetical protein L3K06_01010, partial [Thermoplasmata archaeon]|nr:hypothetical protein [Thermoplasmata archaeon]